MYLIITFCLKAGGTSQEVSAAHGRLEARTDVQQLGFFYSRVWSTDPEARRVSLSVQGDFSQGFTVCWVEMLFYVHDSDQKPGALAVFHYSRGQSDNSKSMIPILQGLQARNGDKGADNSHSHHRGDYKE